VGGNCSGCCDDSGRSAVWIWNIAEYLAQVLGIQSIAEIAPDHASGKQATRTATRPQILSTNQ
jgi:hypothetical protein